MNRKNERLLFLDGNYIVSIQKCIMGINYVSNAEVAIFRKVKSKIPDFEREKSKNYAQVYKWYTVQVIPRIDAVRKRAISVRKLLGGPAIKHLRAFQEQPPAKGNETTDHKKFKRSKCFKQISIYEKSDH